MMEEELKEIAALFETFENDRNVEALRQAAIKTHEIEPMGLRDFEQRQAARSAKLDCWLNLLGKIDRNRRSDQNPSGTSPPAAEPDSDPARTSYRETPPGTVADPAAKDLHQKAVAENEAATIDYIFQTKLRKLDKWSTPRAETYIRRCFLKSPQNRKILENTVSKHLGNMERRKRLISILA